MTWITNNVDLPADLIEAQRNGNLVIFAGAGISISEPSKLPNFWDLAIEVANGFLKPKGDEPVDRFLGRLEKEGIPVHKKVLDIINKPTSNPTTLHYDLLSLFPSVDKIRMVTTNFDKHFLTVARKKYQNNIEIFFAPALPLCEKFNGIAYLHGCVEKGPENLILTDSDFGRAYLTEGWATQFLKLIFTNYVILFIGYSHDDQIMQYLARGLVTKTTDNKRFSLVKSEDKEKWKFFGITPIPFDLNVGKNRYKELRKAVTEWARNTQRGALDHERKIMEIVNRPPPVDHKENDYIKNALKIIETTNFFIRYARTVDWLTWAEDIDTFQNLFKINNQLNEIERLMAFWFARNYAFKYSNEALAIVHRQGQKLNPILVEEITRELAFRDPIPDGESIARWVSILINCNQTETQLEFLNYLIEKLRYPEDNISALLLFEHLTRPHIEFITSFSFFKKDNAEPKHVSAKIMIYGKAYNLKIFWEKFFKPNLGDYYKILEQMLIKNIINAKIMIQAFNQSNEYVDSISLTRSAIEPHNQDNRDADLDIYFDAPRDIIDWMLEHKSDVANYIINLWSKSKTPILVRLSIYGITQNRQISSDEKIKWLLNKNWLYTFGLKHEVFRLLKIAYPGSRKSTRVKLIKHIIKGIQESDTEPLKENISEFEKYNILTWLNQIAPDCPLVNKQLRIINELHPDYVPREYPDLDSWITFKGSKPQSPITVEELIKLNINEKIEWLLTYQGNRYEETDRIGLLNAVSESVIQSFEWGWQLVKVLNNNKKWDSDLWISILKGWQHSTLTKKQWQKIIDFLLKNKQLFTYVDYIADLLKTGISKEQGELPLSCLPLGEDLSFQLIDQPIEKEEIEEENENIDWLGRAINHYGGMIAEFWLNALSKIYENEEEDWLGIPPKYRLFFEKVISSQTYPAQLSCVILTSGLHYLFNLDNDWTRENIIPLLNWNKNKSRTLKCWYGYLYWGHWNEALLQELLPIYEQTFSKLTTELSDMRDPFCSQLANIAVFSSSNPIKNGWIKRFLLETDPESHKSWTFNLSQQFRALKKESKKDLWESWIERYWSQRIKGSPLPLSKDEMEIMVEWVNLLEPVFPEVVDKICELPISNFNRPLFYHKLTENNFAKIYPEALTHLLLHILNDISDTFYYCDEVENLVRELINTEAPNQQLLQICQKLSQFGCPNAINLSELVKANK